jgi:hypothetical protein
MSGHEGWAAGGHDGVALTLLGIVVRPPRLSAASVALALLTSWGSAAPGASPALAANPPNNGSIVTAAGPLAAATTYTGALSIQEHEGEPRAKEVFVFYASGTGGFRVHVVNTTPEEKEGFAGDSCHKLGVSIGDADNSGGASFTEVYPTPAVASPYSQLQIADLFEMNPLGGPHRYYLTLKPKACFRGSQTMTYSFSIVPLPGVAVVAGPAVLLPHDTPSNTYDRSHAFGPLRGDTAYAGILATSNEQRWNYFYTAPHAHRVDIAFTKTGDACEQVYEPDRYEAEVFDSSGRRVALITASKEQWFHYSFISYHAARYYVKVGGLGNCVGVGYEFALEPSASVAPRLSARTRPAKSRRSRR